MCGESYHTGCMFSRAYHFRPFSKFWAQGSRKKFYAVFSSRILIILSSHFPSRNVGVSLCIASMVCDEETVFLLFQFSDSTEGNSEDVGYFSTEKQNCSGSCAVCLMIQLCLSKWKVNIQFAICALLGVVNSFPFVQNKRIKEISVMDDFIVFKLLNPTIHYNLIHKKHV